MPKATFPLTGKLKRAYPIGAGIFAVLCWGSLPAMVKLALETVPITFFLVLRFVIASALCLCFIGLEYSKFSRLKRSQWLFLTVVLAANFTLQAIAVHEIPATWYIAIFSLSPLLSLLFLRIPLNAKSAFGIALALGGTVLFAASSGKFESISLQGLCALLGGMIAWTLYIPAVRPFQSVFSDRQVSTITSLLALLSVSLLWLSQGAPVTSISPQAGLALAIVGLLVPLAYWAFLHSVRTVPVFGITSQYLEPVIGIVFAIVILGESLTALQILGGAVILSGVALIQIK